MEQVDQIIIVTLRDVGIVISSEITSLKQFDTALVVRSVARCVNLINASTNTSEQLPPGMAGRYRVGIELANACKTIGYKADLGYETFLYSSDVEIRRLLMFLVEQLPRTRQDSTEEVALGAGSSSVRRSIVKEIRRQMAQPWLPPQCYRNHIVWDGNRKNGTFHFNGGFQKFTSVPLSCSEDSPPLLKQCSARNLLPSLLELSSRLHLEQELDSVAFVSGGTTDKPDRMNFTDVLKQSQSDASKLEDDNLLAKFDRLKILEGDDTPHNLFKFTETVLHTDDINEKNDEPTKLKEEDFEDLLKQQESEKNDIQQLLIAVEKKLDNGKNKIDNANRRLDDLKASREAKEKEIDKLKEDYMLKKKTLKLVPDEENALTAMQHNISEAKEQFQQMKDQWAIKEESLRSELVASETTLQTKELQTSEFVEEIKLMRDEITTLASSIEQKDETLRNLQTEVENLPESVTRSTHTNKILEIVSRIRKQKVHITEIIRETKIVQKEINSLNGKIERSFIETDEMVFRHAKENEMCRTAYKLLANLQAEFNGLVRGLDDIGVINRELRDLEDLLQREKEKNIDEQISNMSKDLDAIVKDNENIKVLLKQAS